VSRASQGAPEATVKWTVLPYTSPLVTAIACASGGAPPAWVEKSSRTGVAESDPAANMRIHALRPKVPATSAPAVRWCTSAYTGTLGSPSSKGSQVFPPSVVISTPASVPA
jgi:hypothetical protein